jgi:pyruvate/2-oxoglutarate dehydrogenase complex dihydrolipoamide acyltransferase (E2) component
MLLPHLQAETSILGSVGAPMAGTVIEVTVKTGQPVHAGQQLAVLSAMKMETAVCAPTAGVVTQVAVDQGDNLDAGDLIVYIDANAPGALPLNSTDIDPLGSTMDLELNKVAAAELAAAAAAGGFVNGNSSNGSSTAAAAGQQQAVAP